MHMSQPVKQARNAITPTPPDSPRRTVEAKQEPPKQEKEKEPTEMIFDDLISKLALVEQHAKVKRACCQIQVVEILVADSNKNFTTCI